MKAITFTVVFEAGSLNYGEGFGNISMLKKLTRGNGNSHTYVARQALRYDVVRTGQEWFGWDLQIVDREQGAVQFRSDVSIENSPEVDFFGYLKTKKKEGADKREAVVRLSHAMSLEPYRSDMDFMTNLGLSERIGEHPIPVNVEQHQSLYSYTVTIDLDKIGVSDTITLPQEERAKRVEQLLSIFPLLQRNIRGRQENLAPLFVIGGVYPIANPFFQGLVMLDKTKKGSVVQTEPLQDALSIQTPFGDVIENTRIGLVRGKFSNHDELQQLLPEGKSDSVSSFFRQLAKEAKEYYGV